MHKWSSVGIRVAAIVVAGLFSAFAGQVRAQRRRPAPPRPTAVFAGTVVDQQGNAPLCGILAVAIWAVVRVDRAIAGPVRNGSRVRVIVGCPGTVATGHTYRFVVDDQSRIEHANIYSLWGESPHDGLRTFWWRTIREIER